MGGKKQAIIGVVAAVYLSNSYKIVKHCTVWIDICQIPSKAVTF